MKRTDLRNVAIIAHVDHGKTTLVDAMLKQSGNFRENETVEERVMDSGDLEKERGITILAKNTAIMYKGIKINIVDTPGHADFGGEVERILSLVDGVVLLVDAVEGCMPQTRYVLKKALGLNKKPIVVINKVDREGANLDEVLNEVYELFFELGANNDQLEFKVVYCSGRQGKASLDPNELNDNLEALFDTVISEIPCPEGDADKPLQVQICNIDYDDYIGRIGVGRVIRGEINVDDSVALLKADGTKIQYKVTKLYQYEGLKRINVEKGRVGDIVCVSGMAEVNIGDTVADFANCEPLEFIKIDEPTLSMLFMVNNSPFAGKEGKFVTSRHLRERLYREVETNVSMRVKDTDTTEAFEVFGRGELHLSILIEQMRRQGYEFQVSRPRVILKKIDGVLCEPYETLSIIVPFDLVGTIMNKIGQRKGELVNMVNDDRGNVKLEFKISSRGLIGYRSEMLTDTKGLGIMSHVFLGYEPYTEGEIFERPRGSLVAHETGKATPYGLFSASERGKLFISSNTQVYEGMIIGENARAEDVVVNVCREKHLTNTRSSASDESLRVPPPVNMSLEQCIEFIADDECIEVTPKNLRIRKYILSKEKRLKAESRNKK